MIFLEIAMIIVGLGAVAYSFRLTSGSKENDTTKEIADVEDSQRESMRLQSALDSFTTKAEMVCDNLEDKMGQMSNEKIIGISEYSDQVLEKIKKNHDEVVFLYEMMNGKQEEVKQLINDVDRQKAELQDEAVKEYQKMKEQEQQLDEMKKNLETDYLQFQAEQGAFRREFEQLRENYDSLKNEIEISVDSLQYGMSDDNSDAPKKAKDVLPDDSFDDEFNKLLNGNTFENTIDETADDTFDSSVFDAEIARIEEEETRALKNDDFSENQIPVFPETSSDYIPVSEQRQIENHNEEIISLYKKGRSVLEISKMLSLGQGEVKFVIDMYNAG